MKWIFQTKIDFVTCSKLIINELARCATRSDHVHFANNEQTSFTAAFICCFGHTEHDLIKLRLYINWSVQAVNIISESAMWNSSKLIKSLIFEN